MKWSFTNFTTYKQFSYLILSYLTFDYIWFKKKKKTKNKKTFDYNFVNDPTYRKWEEFYQVYKDLKRAVKHCIISTKTKNKKKIIIMKEGN